MKTHCIWIVSSTLAAILILLAGFTFVTWGFDMSTLTSDGRGGLLFAFVILEGIALVCTRVVMENTGKYFR